jgi:hypothetical protein
MTTDIHGGFIRGYETPAQRRRRKARDLQREVMNRTRRIEADTSRVLPPLGDLAGFDIIGTRPPRPYITPEQEEAQFRLEREARFERAERETRPGGLAKGVDFVTKRVIEPAAFNYARAVSKSYYQDPGVDDSGDFAGLQRHEPVNIFKAAYSEEEAEKAQVALAELDPVTRIAVTIAYDPTNALPGIGFTSSSELRVLLTTAREGGEAGVRALRTIVDTPALREEIVQSVKAGVASEARSLTTTVPRVAPDIATPGSYSRVLRNISQREAGRDIETIAEHVPLERAVEAHMTATGKSADDLLGEFATTRAVPEDLLARSEVGGTRIRKGVPEPEEPVGRFPGRPTQPQRPIRDYSVASQSRTAENLARREEDIRRAMPFAAADPERAAQLQGELNQLAAQRTVLRQEVATTVEAMQPAPTRATGFSHERVTPVVDSLENIAETAFGRSGWQRKVGETLSHGPTGFLFRAIDPSRIHQASPIGRPYVAFERLSEILEGNSELGMRALRGYNDGNLPFKVTREGVEETTGKNLSDLIENWDTNKHLFTDLEDGFVQLYNRVRLDTLEDARKLGVYVPDAWKDIIHVWRQVRGKKGIEFQRALGAGARGQKPGSFKHRLYELMEEGRTAGIDYNADFIQVVEAGMLSVRRHAAETAFTKAVKGRGQLISRWVPAALKRTRADAGQRYVWARRVQHYVHESLRGKPPRPTLRSVVGQDPPDELMALVDRVAGINRTMTGRERQKAVLPFRAQIDELTSQYRAVHRTANKQVQRQIEAVNKHAVSGGPFGMADDSLVEVGLAPPSKFPNFQGRLFLKDDLEYLEKVWAKNSNPFLSGAAATSDVFRMGATAVDPGFWFVQGLGAIGLDTSRALTGKAPQFIWAKSAWRSLRNAATNGKSASRYWSREVSLHPEELGEFVRYYRSLTSHAAHSDEFIGAIQRGGILEKVEGAVPVLNQIQPFNRAGNAFAFYMDSFAWESWKALKPLAKGEAQMEELGAFLRAIVGKSSSRGLGVSQTQRLAERAFVAWAPAYTRGSFALMFKAIADPTSFGGRQALKSIAGLAAASTIMGAGVIMAKQLAANNGNFNKLEWEDLPKELADFWDVTHPSKFFTVRIGENNFGIGGAMRSNTAMISRLSRAAVEDPESFSPFDPDGRLMVNFDNPALRAIRAKSSPLTGEAFNLLSGEDYLGFQLDDPGQYLRLSEDATPFALQAYLQAEGGIKGKAGAGTAEFFGFRAYPMRHVDLYHEAAEEESGQAWEDLDAAGELSFMREDPENFPKTAEMWNKYQDELRKKGSPWQKARDVAEEFEDKRDVELGELAQGVQWNRPGGGQFYKDQRPGIMASARQSFDVAMATQGVNSDDGPESEVKDKVLRSKFYELDVTDFMGPDNKPDWERFFAEKERIKLQMSPLAQEAIDKKKLDYDDPTLVQTEQRRLRATDDLQAFFDFPKYNGLTVDESDQVDELLELGTMVQQAMALSGKSVDRSKIMLNFLKAGITDQKIAATALISTKSGLAPMVKSRAADEWALSHPDLAVFFPFIFDSLDEDDQLEWQRLYSLRR